MNKIKEKLKKSATSFLYRLIICVCIFALAFSTKRFFPHAWDKCATVFVKDIDIKSAGTHLIAFLKEILPF